MLSKYARNSFAQILKYGQSRPPKITISELYHANDLNSSALIRLTHEDLKKRLAYKIIELEKFPFAISHMPSIAGIKQDYIDSFYEIMSYEETNGFKNSQDYSMLVENIFQRHTTTILQMARGILEWKIDLEDRYSDVIDLFDKKSQNTIVPTVERTLNDFYDDRISSRLVLNQFLHLSQNSHRFYGADPHLAELNKYSNPENIGIVSLKTRPVDILQCVWSQVSNMSERLYGCQPNINVNGIPLAKANNEIYFPYIPCHIKHIFKEVLKNSVVAINRKYNGDMINAPPIDITLPDVINEESFAIKISDTGCGISYSDLGYLWSYFYSTAEKSILKLSNSDEFDEFDKSAPITGFGHGLPLSRLLIEHFDGQISVNSIENQGTDVHLYFKNEL